MQHSQIIAQPHGVTVFGSAVVRVEPDLASLRFSVGAQNARPADAIKDARTQANSIGAFLQRSSVPTAAIKTSRVSLRETANTGSRAFYATIKFNVNIRELDRLENIVVGLVDSGVANLDEPLYQTTKLRDTRAEARQSAVLAAFKKAELYAEAAGVEIGRVLHIEEIDPRDIGSSDKFAQGDFEEFPNVGAYSPSALQIPAAAFVSFAIKGGGQPEITGQYRVI